MTIKFVERDILTLITSIDDEKKTDGAYIKGNFGSSFMIRMFKPDPDSNFH